MRPTSTPLPDEPPQPRKRVRPLIIGGVIGGLALSALLWIVLTLRDAGPREGAVPDRGPPSPRGQVVLDQDFSNPGPIWDLLVHPRGMSEPVDGELSIELQKSGFLFQGAPLPEDLPEGVAMRVEADVRLVEHSDGPNLAGVVCRSATSGPQGFGGYVFLISPQDGSYLIGDETGIIVDGDGPGVVRQGVGRVNRVAGRCVGATDGRPARAIMFVNGRQVLETTDPDGFSNFVGIMLLATSERGGADFRFDNLVVRRL